MIVMADFLGVRAQRSIRQAERVLDHYHFPQSAYLITDASKPLQAVAAMVLYGPETFSNRGPSCAVALAVQSGQARFQTHLYAALQLLYLLAIKAEWQTSVRNLDVHAPAETLWPLFGLEADRVLTSKVAAFQTGDFIAPCDGGYAFYSVDTHGELTVEAQAEDLAVIIMQYAAMKAYGEERIGNLVGQFAQPVS